MSDDTAEQARELVRFARQLVGQKTIGMGTVIGLCDALEAALKREAEARQAGAREALDVAWRDLQGLTLGRPMNEVTAARQAGHRDAIELVNEHRERFGGKS